MVALSMLVRECVNVPPVSPGSIALVRRSAALHYPGVQPTGSQTSNMHNTSTHTIVYVALE